MKRSVACGRGSAPAAMAALIERAISRIAPQPLALSFAPGF
jgi:hypothetical protein